MLTEKHRRVIINKKRLYRRINLEGSVEVSMGTKGENTKREICREAAKLFSKKGYKDVSMQDICNATGLSKGGLYRHFGSKEEILFQLISKEKRVFEDIEQGKSAVDVLENLLKVYRADLEPDVESMAYALFEYASTGNGHVLDSGNTEDKQYWHKLVEYGVFTGEFNDVDPDVVMDTFLYAFRGAAMWRRVLTFQPETFDHLMEAVRYLLIKDYGRKSS